MSDRERLEYLAAMVAAGAADDAEQGELDNLVASNPDAAAELRAMEEAMAEVALSNYASPPAGGLDAVRAQLAGTSGAAPSRGGAEIISLAARRKLRTMAVVTTVSIAAAAGFAFLWQTERQAGEDARAAALAESEKLADEAARAKRAEQALTRELAAAEKELEGARKRLGVVQKAEVRLATLKRDDGSKAKIFMDPSGRRWLVYAHQLPEIGPDQDYQLWFLPKAGPGPVPAGLLRKTGGVLEAEVEIPEGLTDIEQAAISLEPKGGSKTPTKVEMIGPI